MQNIATDQVMADAADASGILYNPDFGYIVANG
jgi:hypothetical protein